MSQKRSPGPPKEVVDQVLRYQQPGESYEIFVTRTQYNNELYYYAVYRKSKKIIGHLIVREDGMVPFHQDVEGVLRVTVGVNSKMAQFFILGPRWAYTVDQVWHNQEKLLKQIYNQYKMDMPDEVKNAFREFIKVPGGILREYKVIQESYQNARQLYKEMEQRGEITDQTIDEKLDIEWIKLFHAKNNQHLLGLNSEESREQVIRFLSKEIPLWDLVGRWRLQKIKSLHKRMLFNKEERQDVLDVQDDVARIKVGEEEFQKILSSTRNPR